MDQAPLIGAMLAAGLFAGLVAGMFGIGGGFVVVPALATVYAVIFGGDSGHIMHVAIGTSLASIAFTSLRSVQAHAKRGAVDFGVLRAWAAWVAAGAIAGVILARYMDGGALKIAFGIGVLIVGLHFLFPIFGRNTPAEENLPRGPLRAGLGASIGAVSAILGIGGGTPAVLMMTMSGMTTHRAIATAAGFGALIAIPGAIASIVMGWGQPNLPFGSVGFVNIVALAAISAMSMITAPIGVAVAHSLDAKMLKRALGCYLLITSAIMLRGAAPAPPAHTALTHSAITWQQEKSA